MNSTLLIRVVAVVIVALWTMAAPACNVPVFRYALERWTADSYEVIAFYSEPFSTEQQAAYDSLEKLEREGGANLSARSIRLSDNVPQNLRALWDAQDNPVMPWMVVRYPTQTGAQKPVWAGLMNAQTVESLLNSPARKELTQRLLNGDAIVWLLLESGDKQRDEAASLLVKDEIRKLEKLLALPESLPSDPPINPNLPLKISFSILQVARTDPAEQIFINNLLQWNSEVAVSNEPMLFPIFGRGRMVTPLIGKQIGEESIRKMAEFLTGPCSCEIKERNPGSDLLLSASWGSLPGYQEEMLPELPPLVGMSQFASTAAAKTNTATTRSSVASAAKQSPPDSGGHPLARNVVAVVVCGIVLLLVATLARKPGVDRRSR